MWKASDSQKLVEWCSLELGEWITFRQDAPQKYGGQFSQQRSYLRYLITARFPHQCLWLNNWSVVFLLWNVPHLSVKMSNRRSWWQFNGQMRNLFPAWKTADSRLHTAIDHYRNALHKGYRTVCVRHQLGLMIFHVCLTIRLMACLGLFCIWQQKLPHWLLLSFSSSFTLPSF